MGSAILNSRLFSFRFFLISPQSQGFPKTVIAEMAGMVFPPMSMPAFVFHTVSSGLSGPKESSEWGVVLRALQVLI